MVIKTFMLSCNKIWEIVAKTGDHITWILTSYSCWIGTDYERKGLTVSVRVFLVSGSFTEIQCRIRENAKILEGIRDLTPTLVQFWEGPELYYPYSGSVLRQNLGMGCGIGKENDIRDSDGRSSGCGIVVKKERECGIGTPLSPLPPPPPRSRPRFDTDHPTALKRKRVANIKDQ